MWTLKNPSFGDQIRVNRGLYYHHGIYESDDCIYQFASPEGSEISPETAIVCTTSLKKFLHGGTLEVREYSSDELKKLKDKKEIIDFAKKQLGSNMGGYDLFTNNCEHFSNLCAFGDKKSEQIDNIMDILGGLFR